MSEAFTPGPWGYSSRDWRGNESEFDFYISGDIHCPDETEADEYEIHAVGVAVVRGNATAGEIPMANARLISAAPDAHEILTALHEWWEANDGANGPWASTMFDDTRSWRRAVAEYLAKARGDAP